MAEFQEAGGMMRRVSVHEALFLVIGLSLGLQSALAGLGLSGVVWGVLGVYGSILGFTAGETNCDCCQPTVPLGRCTLDPRC